ncbi:MAG: hypothetical protein IAX22_03800 [Candidatus Bathyarchaeota archaeon]|nr:hypothetical protein [Candidatus Bathyarchaeota archaeon]
MKLKDKLAFAIFGVLIFFVSGGLACTYGGTGVINPILVFILGVLVFFTAGAAACNYGNSRIAKRKTNHTQS